jgi:hypothetical protein
MLRRPAIAPACVLAVVGAALTGGCADLMQRSTIAPEWFQAKAVEVKGEGYPEFKDIPTAQGVKGALAQWEAEASDLKKEAAKLQAQGADDPILTDEEVRATAAQWRAQVEEDRAVGPEGAQP